jgi:SAM-dependent methyltransferase
MMVYRDYHDYVIKEGKLVGAFDKMYQEYSDIPWHQDETNFDWYANIDIELLKKVKFTRILDVACGLDFFTERILTIFPESYIIGLDISSTAIQKCNERKSSEKLNYYVGDITETGFMMPDKQTEVDLVLMRDLLWYVTEKVDVLFENILRVLNPKGKVLIHQSFPALHKNFVAKDFFPFPSQYPQLQKNMTLLCAMK